MELSVRVSQYVSLTFRTSASKLSSVTAETLLVIRAYLRLCLDAPCGLCNFREFTPLEKAVLPCREALQERWKLPLVLGCPAAALGTEGQVADASALCMFAGTVFGINREL